MAKTTKPRRIYQKVVTLRITGTNKTAIQKTASQLYGLNTDLTAGGADERKVQITKLNSTECQQIFLGNL